MHSEDTCFFWVFLTQGYLMFSGIPYGQLHWVPQKLFLWKTGWLSTGLFCGKIALCFLVEKLLGGFCSTFICNGLHTYALRIFGIFVKMSVLSYIFVCVHILFFSNMSFLFFSEDLQKLNSRFWSSHIAAIYIAWDFWKKVQVRSISRSCLLLLNQNYLIVYQSKETFG